MTRQTTTTIIIITALIFFGLGFVFADYYKSDNGDNTFQAGWDAAEQRLTETGYAPVMEEDMEITSVNGIIQEIKDDKIYLKIQPLTPLADSELDNRIVEVGENTKIYQSKRKNQEQYQKEMEEFSKETEEQTENQKTAIGPIMPLRMLSGMPLGMPLRTPLGMFSKEEISFSDIVAGMRITVIAQEDIKNAKEFKATEIIIQY